jgi:hypothetical protein
MARSSRKKSSSFADRFDSLRIVLTSISARGSAIAAIAFLAVLAVLALWGVPKLRERMDAQAMAIGGANTVDYIDAPGWFDGKRRAEVSDRVAMAVGDGSVLDPNRLAKARAALQTTGWFHSIEQVRLADDGGFLVEATFVRPFAVVRHGEFDYLVDEAARLLPMQWTAGHRPAEPHYIAIVGTAEPNRGDYGAAWPGGDVAAALELTKLLIGKPWYPEIAAIDLSQFSQDQTLSLITRNNGRLLWGRAPSDRSVAEVTPDAKLRTLDYLYATQKRIDSGGGRSIDLRGDLVTVRADAATDAAPDAAPAN